MWRGFRVALLLWLTFAVTAYSDSARVLQPRSLGEFAYDWYGSVSPDGRFLTYVEWETGDLVLRDLSTGEKRNLTRKQGAWEYDLPPESRHTASNAFAIFSAISPDGKQVAYKGRS
ncbi:MAG: hypothetical protein HY236_12690 [Acidobacteria bacterium]|nr:hypothetical protein [Acidobacteriota bacterium]